MTNNSSLSLFIFTDWLPTWF